MQKKKMWNILGVATTSALIAAMIYSFVLLATHSHDDFELYPLISLSFDVIGIAVCVILLLTTVFDHRMTISTTYFMAMIVTEGFVLFWDFGFWIIDGDPEYIQLNKIINYYLLGFIQLMMVAFWMYITELIPEKDDKILLLQKLYFIIMATGMLIILSNPWHELIFSVDNTGTYERGPAYLITYVSPFIGLIIDYYVSLKYIKGRRKKLALCSYAVLPILACLIQATFFGVNLIYMSLLFSIILIYGNFYVERGQDLVEKQTKLTQQNITLLTAQVQPDFLYKSLDSIKNMEGIPVETRNAIEEFSRYFHGNMDSFSETEPIPFDKELEHVQTYVNLEKLRFKEKLDISFELNDKDFDIPALTLQMLVENAIKHGITTKEMGGHITVITTQNSKEHKIVVIDDGVGFDTTMPKVEDGRSHVGLANVRQRLDEMVQGTLTLESTIGVGTTAIITIPKHLTKM